MAKTNQRRITKGNIEFLIERFPSKLASVTLLLPGGTFYEIPSQKNLAHLTEHLITLTPNTRENYIDWRHNYYHRYKIKIEACTYKNHSAITVTSPSKTFKMALDFLFENWLNQNISDKDFQRAKYTVISEELQYCDNPVNHSIDKFNKSFGGDINLFADSFEKYKASEKATIDQIKSYLKWTYNSDKTKISMCGNLDFHLVENYLKKIHILEIGSNFKFNKFIYKNIKKHRETSPVTIIKNDLLNLNYIVLGFYSDKKYNLHTKLLFMLLHTAFKEFIYLFCLSTGLSYVSKTGLEVMPYNSWLKTYLQVNPVHVELLIKNIIKELENLRNDKGIYTLSRKKLIDYFTKPLADYRAYELAEIMYYSNSSLSLSDTIEQLNLLTYSEYKNFLDNIINVKNLKILIYGNIKRSKLEIIKNLKYWS